MFLRWVFMVCFVVMCSVVLWWFSVVSSLWVWELLRWYLIFIVFCFIVGREILGGNVVWMWDFRFKCFSLVIVRMMVLYLLLFSLFRWVLMLFCREWIIRFGWCLVSWYWWCKLDVLMILFVGNVFRLL